MRDDRRDQATALLALHEIAAAVRKAALKSVDVRRPGLTFHYFSD
jgi:hypothetical protein